MRPAFASRQVGRNSTRLLGGVSTLALCFGHVGPAYAQDAPQAAQSDEPGTATQSTDDSAATDDGTIVVTGIRRSLRTSQEIKRDLDVVVDSVTADDIGALPDRSVTEALQRIPGVAIDRFAAGRDPDHFSTEGSGVVVRGLTYVRSELNGRDTFTANNGRALSYADIPSELLGGIDVFKTPSADMVEGGISGTVNLRTRLPFDNAKGYVVAGSLEMNWGDLREKWTPTVSVFASGRWDTSIGEFGLLGSFALSKLKWRNDGLQISNYGIRTLYDNGDVVATPGSAPIGGAVCDAADPSQDSCVYLPRGAVMRTQDTDRKRIGYSAAAQWRSNDDHAGNLAIPAFGRT